MPEVRLEARSRLLCLVRSKKTIERHPLFNTSCLRLLEMGPLGRLQK